MKACKCFVGIPKGKRPVGRPKRRWVNRIKMNVIFKGIEHEYVDGIPLAQDVGCANMVMALKFRKKRGIS